MAQSVIVLDATVGGVASNSYITLAECDEYLHARPFHSKWDAITDDDEKKAAILWSTRILSHYGWVGAIADSAQALPWPRSGTYDKDNRLYVETALPEWLKVSCAELAYYLAVEDRLGDTGTEGFKSMSIGELSMDINPADRPDWIPNYLMRAIRPWINETQTFTSVRA